jgi:pimeloyl-ACP methyl ester carboxylesterase
MNARLNPIVSEVGPGFESATIAVNGSQLHCVRGGEGPPIVLIHGFPQDWYEYRAIMPRLAKRFTLIAVDLRGIGGSSVRSGGYDAVNMADDVYELLRALKLQNVYVVGHDLGGIVAHALVRRHPEVARGAMILDVALPGIDGYEATQGQPAFWHIPFMQVPGLPEQLVQGREEAYLGYFFNFGKFTAAEKAHYIDAYSTPAQLHAIFEMYRAFPTNAKFNRSILGPIDVPVFLGTGEQSPFASVLSAMAQGLRSSGFERVETGTIPSSVHYLLQDNPDAVASLIEERA